MTMTFKKNLYKFKEQVKTIDSNLAKADMEQYHVTNKTEKVPLNVRVLYNVQACDI